MAEFDGERITYSDQHLVQPGQDEGGAAQERGESQKKAREFIRNFRLGASYVYRDRLLQMHRKRSSGSTREATLELDLAHLSEYDPALLDNIQVLYRPTQHPTSSLEPCLVCLCPHCLSVYT